MQLQIPLLFFTTRFITLPPSYRAIYPFSMLSENESSLLKHFRMTHLYQEAKHYYTLAA